MTDTATIKCPACERQVRMKSDGVELHYATNDDTRPCIGSWKRLCSSCGFLLHTVDGKILHLVPKSNDPADAAAAALRCNRTTGP